MKAVILAAGVGSRLKPITDEKPKTLVKVNGKPILGYAIDAIQKVGINDVILCVGYRASQIIEYCQITYPNINFIFIENKNYYETNNMYSLYLARDFLDEDILLMNGDVIFEQEIVKRLVEQKTTSIAVDKSRYLEEAMKIIVKDDLIRGISKEILPYESYGCSIDVYKILKKDLNIIKKEMHKIIEVEKKLNQWTEVMLDNLFRNKKLVAKPLDIKDNKWFEIDDCEDLKQAELLFNDNIPELINKKIFFIDIDGTLMLGNNVIEGANRFIDKLGESNKLFYILTNNSSKSPQQHLQKLNSAGLNVSINNVLVSTVSALEYLKQNKIKNIYFIANSEVSEYILNQGFSFDDESPEALLLTYDDELTYEKIKKFSLFVRQGIPYYSTHSDIVCPTPEGSIPDIGTFIKMIEMTTGYCPNKIFGKPDKTFLKTILTKYDLVEKDAVIIGDRLYTDIKLAENSTLTSVLVLTGETTRERYEKSTVEADIVVSRLNELVEFI